VSKEDNRGMRRRKRKKKKKKRNLGIKEGN
jgi:hypothetical protein